MITSLAFLFHPSYGFINLGLRLGITVFLFLFAAPSASKSSWARDQTCSIAVTQATEVTVLYP